MKRTIRIIFSSFIVLLSSTGITQAACIVDQSYNEWYLYPGYTFGRAYATETTAGACRTACKAWGTTGISTINGTPYQAYHYAKYPFHPYWFPGDTNAICEVSGDWRFWTTSPPSYGPYCPQSGDGGVHECNYL